MKKHITLLLIFISSLSFCQDNFNTGLQFFNKNEYEKAIKSLELELRSNPKDVEAIDLIGRCYYKLDDFNKAISYFNKVKEINPNYSNNLFFSGNAKLKSEDFEGALNDFMKYNVAFPDDHSIHNNIGLVNIHLNRINEGILEFDKAIMYNSNHSDAYANRAEAKYRNKLYTEALNDVNEAIKINPNFGSAFRTRAIINHKIGKVTEACADLNKSFELLNVKQIKNNNDCNTWLKTNDLLLQVSSKQFENKFQEEIDLLNKIIVLNPENAEYYAKKAFAEGKLKQFDKAILSFDKAMALDDKSYLVYLRRGEFKAELKDFKGAILDYDKSMSLKANDFYLYFKRGAAKYFLKDQLGAIDDLDKSISLNKTFSDSYAYRGYCKSDLNQNFSAIDDYTMAIKMDEKNADAYINRAICYIKNKNFDEALIDANKSIELAPDDIRGLNVRGQIKATRNDFQGAAEDLEKVLIKKSKDVDVLNNLIYCYTKLEDRTKLCETYKKLKAVNKKVIEELEAFCK